MEVEDRSREKADQNPLFAEAEVGVVGGGAGSHRNSSRPRHHKLCRHFGEIPRKNLLACCCCCCNSRRSRKVFLLLTLGGTVVLLLQFAIYSSWRLSIGGGREKTIAAATAALLRGWGEVWAPPSPPRRFQRPPAAAHLDCGRLLAIGADSGDASQLQRLAYNYEEEESGMAMDCEAIRARHHFPPRALSAAEADFPWAHARIVFRDYALVEAELAASYQPQNWYCYVVDADASEAAGVKQRLHALAACFPNVVVAGEAEVDDYTHSEFPLFMKCFDWLLEEGREWKYVTVLENHDVQIKTNAEVVRILRWLDGANDVETQRTNHFIYDANLDWSFSALGLFRNPDKNDGPSSVNGYPPQLAIFKGYGQTSLSRAMVEFMLRELDLSTLLERQEQIHWWPYETYVASLNTADALEAPGGFTRHCLDQVPMVPSITRMSQWVNEDGDCPSRKARHHICLVGVESLRWLATEAVELFANKMWPEWDYGALVCWHEWMFNRTHHPHHRPESYPPKKTTMGEMLEEGGDGETIEKEMKKLLSRELNEICYKSLPQVRFQEFKRLMKKKSNNNNNATTLAEFNCEYQACHLHPGPPVWPRRR